MRSKPVILVALLLAAFAINLDTTMVNVALPTPGAGAARHDEPAAVGGGCLQPGLRRAAADVGSLSDRLGRKGMLLAGLGVFGTASVAGGFTTSPGQLIAARAVMGLGAAMTFPATLSLISNVFTERAERARAIGLWGASAGVAVALGPIVGGWLLEHFSLGQHLLRHGPGRRHGAHRRGAERPDLQGSGGAPGRTCPGLCCRPWPWPCWSSRSSRRRRHGLGSARSVAGFAVPARCSPRSSSCEHAPTPDARHHGSSATCGSARRAASVTVAFFTLFGFIFLMTQYFQFIRGYGPLSTGVHLLPGRAGGRRRLDRRNPAGRAGRHQAGRHGRADRHGGVLRLGRGETSRDHQLRRHRRADGALRARHGLHLGAGHRVHHGRGARRPRPASGRRSTTRPVCSAAPWASR